MKIGSFDTDDKIMVIAEIGNNHEGNFDLAVQLIQEAAKVNVDAVKFQTFKTEFFSNKKNKERFNRLKSFELEYDQFRKLKEIAENEGLIFLSTPFDLESAQFLNDLVPAFKVSSSDNTFYPLLQKIAGFNKPTILSSALASLEEIIYSKNYIEKIWREKKFEQEMAILHCVCSYPVDPKEANVSLLKLLQKKLNCLIGYSDHTIGITASILSVAYGAQIIEKHFTIDKNYSDFRDHQLSCNPVEMAQLVKEIRNAEQLIGDGTTEIQESESDIISAVRRSIVAVCDLNKGDVVGAKDICWVRPGGGIAPGDESLVVGKMLVQAVKEGDIISSDFFHNK